MHGFFIRLLIIAISLWIASAIVPGIEINEPSTTLLLAAILLSVVNAMIKPLIIILTMPISIITFGLFLLVINAGMLGIVAWLLDDFMISGFFAALFGSFVVSFLSELGVHLMGTDSRIELMMDRKN